MSADDLKDLGLGARVIEQSRSRTLNRNGSFNVRRDGLTMLQALSPYHALLTMSWPHFYALVALGYLVANVVFATAFLLCGPQALQGTDPTAGLAARVFDDFFFSVQTLATIGYGRLSPNGLAANILVAVEALVGMLSITMATGLSFARFARPDAHIRYSRQAILAPFRGATALMFRVINERSNQLTRVEAQAMLGRMENVGGKLTRRFYPLNLERAEVMFFPLHWTIVHPIDAKSPLLGETSESLRASDAEILVLLSAIDESSSQTVYSRSSYKFDEIVPGVRFVDMFLDPVDGMPRIDVRRLDQHEPA
jgi:inward rectifier potassium channel